MNVPEFVRAHRRAIGIGAGVAVLGAGVAGAVYRAKKKRRTQRKRTRKTYRRNTPRKQRRRRSTPRTAGKRRDTSKRRIRYTKNGQPYIILASGKARFIKAKSARSSHKRKGGRY